MKPSEKTQARVIIRRAQAAALDRISKQRNVSKQALLREGVEWVTGVESGIRVFPPSDCYGFTNPSHPSYRGKRREAKA